MVTANKNPQGESFAVARRRPRPAPGQRLSTISDLAKEFGVTLRTLRFYEDRGLLNPVRDGTTRLYDERDKARLAKILEGKRLGFTLGEIRDLIAKGGNAGEKGALMLDAAQIASQIDHLKRQRDGIDDAIAQLSAVHGHLIGTRTIRN